MKRLIITCNAAYLFGLGAVWVFSQGGPLDPPLTDTTTPEIGPDAPVVGGNAAPTMKTLHQIEPRTPVNATTTPGNMDATHIISAPGSYYLTSNIKGEDGKNGIEIQAPNVSLDLMGFDLDGTVASGTSGEGVFATGTADKNIVVKNGSVRNWGLSGVDLSNAANSAIEEVRASRNTGDGMQIGTGGQVRLCTAYANSGDGIEASSGGCVISDCASSFNTVDGFRMLGPGEIVRCAAYENTNRGFATVEGVTIADCAARGNDSHGILTGDGCTVTRCAATANSNGIVAGSGCTISICSASGNTNDGIVVAGGSTVMHCVAAQNSVDGMQTNGDNGRFVENFFFDNGDQGFKGSGNNNVLEGNHASNHTADESFGFSGGSGNLLIRNSSAGSVGSGYNFPAGNPHGTITTPTPGFSSTDDYLNFSW